ncbi:TonB-dependent receptor [uncultured Sphingomonas sp.]|uniref:TonB-dependent receptor n=1 Tax=uncultured Sphingomonas sp. TaxID=158754 RepID=UPI0035CA8890
MVIRFTRGRLMAAAALAVVAWPQAQASAQTGKPAGRQTGPAYPTAPRTAPDGTAPDNDASEGDIVVTALRRQERQVSVPAAVTVVNADTLVKSGVSKFQDLGNLVPGVQISRSGSYTQPAIRGVTTTFAGNGQETNVGVYIDGFYQSDQLSINQDFANLANIQVLKGPQAVLYGRNATGGAILITTKSPGDQLEGNASISYARYDDIIAQAYVSVPVVKDVLAVNIAGYFRKNDGYFKDVNNFAPNQIIRTPGLRDAIGSGDNTVNYRQRSLRAKARFTPGSGVSLTFGYNYTFINDPRGFAYGIIGQSPYAALVPTAAAPNVQVNQRDKTSLNLRPQNLSEGDEFTLLGEFDLGSGGSITTHTGYLTKRDHQIYDFDGTPFDGFEGLQINKRRTFTQGLDYSVNLGDRLTLLAGAFYYSDSFRTTNGTVNFVGATGVQNIFTVLPFSTRSYSAYIDATYKIGNHLYLTAGGRYNYDRKVLSRTDIVTVGGVVQPVTTGGAAQNFGGPVRESNKRFTPHAVIRYEFDPDTNLYASISTGFKAGTINSAFPLNVLKPETVTAYEIGYKMRRGPFYLDASGFYYDYKDNQVAALLPVIGQTSTFIQNSGGAEIYGADGSITARVADAFNLRAGLAYLHARYTNFANANNISINASGTANTTVIADWTGRRIARAPDWTGSFGGDYTVKLAGGDLQFSGTASFSSRYAPQNASYNCRAFGVVNGVNTCVVPGTLTPDQGKGQPGRLEENGWFLFGGQIQWTDPSDHYTIAIYAENLTNERYKIISSASAYGTYEMYNQPRSIGGRLGVKF